MPGPRPLRNDLKAARRTMRPDRAATARKAAEKRVLALVARIQTEVRCLLALEWEGAELAELDRRVAVGATQLHALISFDSPTHFASILVCDGRESEPIGTFETWMEIAFREAK